MNRITKVAAVGLLAVLGACTSGDEATTTTASAAIAPTAANTVTGTAKFTASGGPVSLTITIAGATPGMHGMHIHQNPACTLDGMDAGAHWDGTATAGDMTGHGLPDSATHHLGDLGNVTIAADGTGTLTRTNAGWTVGDGAMTDVVGHAIIFHANPDDGTMPSAGGRFGCGVIAAD